MCDDYWDINDGDVVCKQLGYGVATAVYDVAYFGSGNGTIWADDVNCKGTEARLEYCSHSGWGNNDCDHSEDAGVACLNITTQGEFTWDRLI